MSWWIPSRRHRRTARPRRPRPRRPGPLEGFRIAMAALWTIVILVLCWMPGEWVQEVEEGSSWFQIPNLDKVVHWGIFVVFTVLWLRTGTSRWRYAWVALGGLAVASITELVQNAPRDRSRRGSRRRHHGPDRRRDRPGRRPLDRAPAAPDGIPVVSRTRHREPPGREWRATTVETHAKGNDDDATLGPGVRDRDRDRSGGRWPRLRADEGGRALSLAWDKEILTIRGAHLPGGAVEVWYIEAFCRPGSTRSRLEADRHPPQDRAGRVGRRRPSHPAPVAAGGWRRGRPRDPRRAGRGRFPRGRDQPDRASNRRHNGPSRASGSIATRARRRSTVVGRLPAALFPLRRRPAGPDADDALGPHGGLHSRAGLVSRRRQPRRRQPPAAEPDRPVQRPDRLRLGRRQGAAGHRLGTLPGAVPGRHRLPALRLPHRRPEARASRRRSAARST